MSKVLIIGAGGVGTVVAHKVAQSRSIHRSDDCQPYPVEMRCHRESNRQS